MPWSRSDLPAQGALDHAPKCSPELEARALKLTDASEWRVDVKNDRNDVMTSATIHNRLAPGRIREAVVAVLSQSSQTGMKIPDIEAGVEAVLGVRVSSSSVRSFLNLNEPELVRRVDRGVYALSSHHDEQAQPVFEHAGAQLFQDDALAWLARREPNSIHAVVTDPPYGIVEYTAREQMKLRSGKGGVWRIPPTFDGVQRAPVPRFTTLSASELVQLQDFFTELAQQLVPALVPGANVMVAANPLVSHLVATSMTAGGLERRGEIVRLVQTMRGGDRPKGAHEEFADVSVMPRSQWEPWLLFRKPITGTVAANLRTWGTGGFRRISDDRPFGDVIRSAPTRSAERALAPHPSLKPQAFLRQVVRASLPMGKGVVLDPFAGSGSTLAAAAAVGYEAIGIERDPEYVEIARAAIPPLAALRAKDEDGRSLGRRSAGTGRRVVRRSGRGVDNGLVDDARLDALIDEEVGQALHERGVFLDA